MTRKFAVFGNPIKQSLSPQIHQNFAQQHKLDISYERILSEEDRFSDHLNNWRSHSATNSPKMPRALRQSIHFIKPMQASSVDTIPMVLAC